MLEAAFWGLVASSSLVVGALIALALHLRPRTVGLIMAFGAGTLISAVAYELLFDAVLTGDERDIVAGLLLGSLTFFAADSYISRMGGAHRKSVEGKQAEGQPTAIVLGTVLDGIPESLVLGVSVVEGGGASVALVGAVFISNLPESIAATVGLRKSGWGVGSILSMWGAIALVSGASAALGFAIFENSDQTGTLVEAFAAGAILTMLTTAMIPEAYENSGRVAGVVAVLGFILALALTLSE